MFMNYFAGTGFQCPRYDGFYKHPEYCDVFYQCLAGRSSKRTCPAGTIFSDEYNVCEYAGPIHCKSIHQTSKMRTFAKENSVLSNHYSSDNIPHAIDNPHNSVFASSIGQAGYHTSAPSTGNNKYNHGLIYVPFVYDYNNAHTYNDVWHAKNAIQKKQNIRSDYQPKYNDRDFYKKMLTYIQ